MYCHIYSNTAATEYVIPKAHAEMEGDTSLTALRPPNENNNCLLISGLPRPKSVAQTLLLAFQGQSDPPDTTRHSCLLGEAGENHLILVQSSHSPPSSKMPFMKPCPSSVPALQRSKMLPCKSSSIENSEGGAFDAQNQCFFLAERFWGGKKC